MIRLRGRTHALDDEREKMARLEQAEAELTDLKDRMDRAVEYLDARTRRNHWRESIEKMIRGEA